MRRRWTENERQYLKENYPHKASDYIAKRLHRSLLAVYNQAQLMGLKKTEEYKKTDSSGCIKPGERRGTGTEFKKGQTPWNKNKKGLQIGGKQTQFKPGHLPHNTKTDGAISTRLDSSGRPYKYIRISKGQWVLLHRYIWEQANGKIPKGYILVFKDGNPQNCTLENLELITRIENMARNTIQRYPEELIQVIKTHKKLTKKIESHEE